MKKIFYTIALGVLLAIPAWGVQEKALETDNTVEEGKTMEAGQTVKVDEMVVTATRGQGRAIDVPTHVEVISSRQIEQSGAMNIGDLLGKYTTGHLHKYNGILTSVGIRGFRTEAHGDDIKGYVLILVDGHRMGTGNAAKIDVSRVEKIEVIKGPASALYGSAAMGGVINIITKKSTGKIKTTLSQEFGSFDYSKSLIYSGGSINEKFGYDLCASYTDTDDYDEPEFGTVYNVGTLQKNIGGNIAFDPGENHIFRLGFDVADLTGESPSWEDGTYSSYDREANSTYDKSHSFFDLEYNGSYLEGKLKWKAMAYYLWDKNHWFYGSPDPELSQSEYTDDTLGTDQQLTYELASWNTMVVGCTLETLEKESKGVSGGVPSLPYTPNMEYDSQAFFIQDSMDFLDNQLNLVVAARYDNFDMKTKHPETGNLQSINERSESFDHVSPKAGVSMKFLDEMLRVRTNIGAGFKAPSADQMSAMYKKISFGTEQRYLGNPNLDPETSLTWDAGFDIILPFADVNAGWFHTDFKDKIVTTTTEYQGETWNTWKNSGESEIEGIDLNLRVNVSSLFNLEPAITFYSNITINTEYRDKDTDEDLLYISDYEVKSGINMKHMGFGAGLSHVLVGPQMITNYDTYEDEEKGSFSFWDLNLSYAFLKNYEVKLNVLNLFDQSYEWIRGYYMPERSFTGTFSFTF